MPIMKACARMTRELDPSRQASGVLSPTPLRVGTPRQATGPPRQAMGPRRSGAGEGVGMLRGAGDSLTENRKVCRIYKMFIS